MEITLNALLEGKPTVIGDKEFYSTKEYVKPFIDEMSKFTDDFIVNVQLPKQITVSNNTKDLTYNKVWIQAILPNKIEDYNETYGLIYSLDSRIPVYKVYRAYIHTKTKNLLVFDNSWIQVKLLQPNQLFKFSIEELAKKPCDIERRLKSMRNTFISPEIKDKQELLGKLVDRAILYENVNVGGKVKISSIDVISAYDAVYNKPTSNYYVSPTVEGNLHNYYSALCNQITTGKDIINRFEKTILVGMLFDLVEYETSDKS